MSSSLTTTSRPSALTQSSRPSPSTSSTAKTPPSTTNTPTRNPGALPNTDSPGNWRHPRLDEIARRQEASSFSARNVRVIALNAAAFVAIHVVLFLVRRHGPSGLLPSEARPYLSYATLILRLIPIVNIINALLPLVRKQDDLSDIPLTPGQRKLLGLAPSSAPPTPGSVYSTPPRYTRTPSVGGSPASMGSLTAGGTVGGGYGSSPLSGRGGSPGANGNTARLGGSPMGGSPLALQKTVGSPLAGLGLNGGQRRSSFGSPSSLGGGPATPKGGLLLGDSVNGTPSPTAGKRSSVGLNSKWLYDRGRRSSGGVKLY